MIFKSLKLKKGKKCCGTKLVCGTIIFILVLLIVMHVYCEKQPELNKCKRGKVALGWKSEVTVL